MEEQSCDAKASFVLRLQQSLLLRCLAPWPRAGRSLLAVNCGDGAFLPLLQECGFDLTATEPDAAMRESAAARAPRVELLAACGDHLPCGDESFDHVLLHVRDARPQALRAAVGECYRVAASGMAVAFWNSASLPLLLARRRPDAERPRHAVAWWRVWRELELLEGRVSGAGVLSGPRCSWHDGGLPSRCNLPLPWPFGAWSMLRLDMSPALPVTPLPLRFDAKPLRQPEPALEYGQKSRRNALNVQAGNP